ncbi:aldolase/citrate lyase family protein [Verminephrobacter eiseniae]|uniref:2-dehydro-3-deoxyglucarate aldolase n=1 Tax=Verminephrobacter eiseniae (strain EF01-2) TaxID=391735 RepID=A1WG19_VEREI|nr:aldolase/citrate lyase family protein [Verminephrobacter eiseniae]ABM56576.1 2-dehydro-3-deoxyglucarate aldolase [Verminephrobacter eiseniae EF01-2]MCW5286933.1 2-dehydro-3-deoxyglucarate aldolase [Verminephrobacter eiseniae]MCW5305231.1 2-dehydro-3-deoxyglucarate aldolase [Verminephrobacter eiseniae]MCW8180893.1 2-dehydro-3-deoxyglucarate aldolase [Verminephrobacter eiseniae]MCW8189473.1 2-dehydro-3-deoxyglucarate aldolase [Verminephrobacter eiseniae]
MHTPTNLFKQAIAQRQAQIGLWLGLADAYSAELLASTGYDWLLVDGEHAPNDLRSILHQLQAIASATSALPAGAPAPHPIARVPIGDQTLIKQYLDIGVQTLLVPMVDTAEQAQALVRATRYAPAGMRGMGSAMARASRWQSYPDYVHQADQQICLLVQAETVQALGNLDAIAATPGVDGVFIGPADLSASMGHPGHPEHPSVQAAIQDGIGRILRAGKAPGILVTSEPQAHQWLAAGALFVAVGVDAQLLVNAARKLLAGFRAVPAGGQAPRAAGY